MTATRFRAGLAAIVCAGAFHLDPGQAAASPPRQDACRDYAIAYATIYCNINKVPPSAVSYSCHPDGSTTIHSVMCATPM